MVTKLHHLPSRVQAQAAHLAKLRGFCENGQLHDAMAAAQTMFHHQLPISSTILYCLIQGCIQNRDLDTGKRLYSLALDARRNLLDSFLGCHFIHMFSLCGSLYEASSVFDRIHEPSVYCWSAIIQANVKHGQNQESIYLYQKMHRKSACITPDSHVFVAILKACSNACEVMQGQFIHGNIVELSFQCDVVITNALIDMYHRCGSLQDAFRMFCQSSKRDLITWNSMISGFANHKRCKEAYSLMEQMRCNGVEPNLVTWNSVLSGYAQNGDYKKALEILEQMQQAKIEPDCFTFTSLLKACGAKGAFSEGKWIHTQLIRSGIRFDLQISNALVDMYVKCGRLEDACKETHKLSSCDVVTWTSMIVGYTQHGHNHTVLQIFQEMEQGNTMPDHFAFTSLLKASTNSGAIDQGKIIHAYVIESSMELDGYIRSAIIDMYVKCGSLECAYSVFGNLLDRDVVSWSAMIGGCSSHGEYKMALIHLQHMLWTGLEPNSAIFLCLLSACGHLGIVDEGKSFFSSMTKFHGLMPTVEHYNCIVDLLGHAGCLSEAEEILKGMPFHCNIVGWISLLSSCKLYADVELGKRCFDQVIALDEKNASAYLLMFSIYADADMPESANRIHKMRYDAFTQKEAGISCIEVGAEVHNFCVGDESHPQNDQIYAKLKNISVFIKQKGYVPQCGLQVC